MTESWVGGDGSRRRGTLEEDDLEAGWTKFKVKVAKPSAAG